MHENLAEGFDLCSEATLTTECHYALSRPLMPGKDRHPLELWNGSSYCIRAVIKKAARFSLST